MHPAGIDPVPSVDAVHRAAIGQLERMSWCSADPACADCLRSIRLCVDQLFRRIAELAREGRIQPSLPVRLAEAAPAGGAPPVVEAPARAVRLGVYPVAGNPLHWGHLVVGLSVMAALALDKVVVLVAGSDPRKPGLVSADERHRLARSILRTFDPLFAYSPLPLGTDLDGETNLGRLLALNFGRPLDVTYVAGGDHCRRTTEAGQPDTIQKLEEVSRRCAARAHRISAAFVDREGRAARRDAVETFLHVSLLPPIPLAFSSTAARRALCRPAPCEALMSLPWSTYREIRQAGLYTAGAECREETV